MDNDNKVNNIHKEVMLFLGDELTRLHQSKSNQIYDLQKEYAKTKKNKSPFVILILVACFIVVIGVAFVMHKVISSHNEEITVSLQEFDDLNLKSLLDTVSSAQTNYDNAVKAKAQLEADMESKLKEAADNRDNDIFVLNSMNIKRKSTYNERLAIINKEYDLAVQAVHKDYDDKISQADKEVQAYKEQLAEFDAAKVESARQQEKALDSERQLRELETKRLTDQYDKRIAELETTIHQIQIKKSDDIRAAVEQVSKKYQAEIDALDPTLRDSFATDIIDDAKETSAEDFDATAFLNEKSVNDEKVLSFAEDYQQLYDNFKYLDDVVASIPQKNSIPNYVSAARTLVNDMGKTFISTTVDYYEETEELNGEIEDLNGQIEDLNGEISGLEADLVAQKEEADATLESSLGQQKSYYNNILENLLTSLNTRAIILEAKDYDNISVYVSQTADWLIVEEGADAEIKIGKGIKGKIFKDGEKTYHFEVAADKNGEIPEVDFSLVIPGSSLKILKK